MSDSWIVMREMARTLVALFDAGQFLNSFLASLCVALLLSAPAIFVAKKVFGATVRNWETVATAASLVGLVVLPIAMWPSIRAAYQEGREVATERQQILSRVPTRDDRMRLLFSCSSECEIDLLDALESCLHSDAQARVYGYSRRRRGDPLRAVFVCMENLGYSVASCDADSSPCLVVPEVGIARIGYTARRYRTFAYDCGIEGDGEIRCRMAFRSGRVN